MKNNLTNEYQENEINKILQDGIDKSLLYINSFNTSNFRNFSKSSKLLTNKKNEEKISNNNSQKIKIGFIPLTKSQLNIKSRSLNKTLKHYNKKNLAYYQIEYNKKREELENSKNELIKERIKQNKLQNDMRIRLKKEKEFVCDECEEGYLKSDDGRCHHCSEIGFTHCKKCKRDIENEGDLMCVQCSEGYFLTNEVYCTKCNNSQVQTIRNTCVFCDDVDEGGIEGCKNCYNNGEKILCKECTDIIKKEEKNLKKNNKNLTIKKLLKQ